MDPKKIWENYIILKDCRFYYKLKLNILYALTLHKKWSFPLRVSSVNGTKLVISSEFGYIYWRNP